MTKEQIAERLNNSEYLLYVPEEVAEAAKAAGIVIVFGASDDLMEFRGAIHEETGASHGRTAYIYNGELFEDLEECTCRFAKMALKEVGEKGKKIEALWCAEEGYSWTYKTEIPHATFEVVEDSEPYCRGIVFDLNDCQ